MIHYISKRETPLIEDDALCILGLSREDYHAALRDGRLRRSIIADNDPTGRLMFHNFWDLLQFSLSMQLTKLAIVPDAAASFAAECCDDLALDERDIIPITGDAEADYAVAQQSWTDDPDAAAWPTSLLDRCTELLLRVGQHISAIGVLGSSTRHAEPRLDQAWEPAFATITRYNGTGEPVWKMHLAA